MADEPRWLNPDELQAWRNLALMQLQLDALLGRELAAEGLSYQDYLVLAGLGDHDGEARLHEISHALGWEKSRASHHITRMEKRGLVAKHQCPHDGRGLVVTITEAGRAAMESAAPGHVATVRRHFVDLLSPEQIRELDVIAQTVLENLPRS